MKKYILSALGALVLAAGAALSYPVSVPLDVDRDGDGTNDIVMFQTNGACISKVNSLKNKTDVTADEALVIRAIGRHGCGVLGNPMNSGQSKIAEQRIVYGNSVFNDMSKCDTKEKFYLCIKERVRDENKLLGDFDTYGDFKKFILYLREDIPDRKISNTTNVEEIVSEAQRKNSYDVTKKEKGDNLVTIPNEITNGN